VGVYSNDLLKNIWQHGLDSTMTDASILGSSKPVSGRAIQVTTNKTRCQPLELAV
jgi:hypothetical protein